MLDLRLHVVMGKASASLWCTSHGAAHCLWSSSSWTESDRPEDLVGYLAQAALCVAERARCGVLDLTDECC